jgi:hypothetical protein
MAEDTSVVRFGEIVKSFFPFFIDYMNKICWSELQFFGLALISIAEVMFFHKVMPLAVRQPSILKPKGLGCAMQDIQVAILAVDGQWQGCWHVCAQMI